MPFDRAEALLVYDSVFQELKDLGVLPDGAKKPSIVFSAKDAEQLMNAKLGKLLVQYDLTLVEYETTVDVSPFENGNSSEMRMRTLLPEDFDNFPVQVMVGPIQSAAFTKADDFQPPAFRGMMNFAHYTGRPSIAVYNMFAWIALQNPQMPLPIEMPEEDIVKQAHMLLRDGLAWYASALATERRDIVQEQFDQLKENRPALGGIVQTIIRHLAEGKPTLRDLAEPVAVISRTANVPLYGKLDVIVSAAFRTYEYQITQTEEWIESKGLDLHVL